MTSLTTPPLVVAHRGNSSVAPENTLAAFEAAWCAGADIIEIDLHLLARGGDAVVHDTTVDATTDGTGPVAELDVAQLGRLDAGAWFAEAYRGQRVPTSADVLAFLTTHPGVGLLAELKGVWGEGAVRRFAGAVAAHGLEQRVLVQSSSTETVTALRDAAPGLRRGLVVTGETTDLLGRCLELGVSACNPCVELLLRRPALVGDLHAAGVQVMPWTLNDPAHWRTAVSAGVDGIITDRPDRLRGWLAGATASVPSGPERPSTGGPGPARQSMSTTTGT